jgi:uncharacterized protein (DUF885 family)
MSETFDFIDASVERWCELDPCLALQEFGIEVPGRITDYSPAGEAERQSFFRSTIASLQAAQPGDAADSVAADNLVSRLQGRVDVYESGESVRMLNAIAAPHVSVRSIFDVMPQDNAEDWEHITARLATVPTAIAGIRESLEAGVRQGTPASLRQARLVARQCGIWGHPDRGIFAGLVGAAPDAFRSEPLTTAAIGAGAAFSEFAVWLERDLLPVADPVDGVGHDRYVLAANQWLDDRIDPLDAYQWGWEELRRINAEMARVASEVSRGATLDEARAHLDRDPHRVLHGPTALRDWLQDLMDRTVIALDPHFDLVGGQRHIEAMLAPPGGATAPYYTAPSKDGRVPGRTWYPVDGQNEFRTWRQVSTCYHEGVPGHHLQHVAAAVGPGIDRVRRSLFSSGHGEGWALYAERLMDELGYLDDLGDRLGYLQCQALRAARVAIDIGLHLHLDIPADDPVAGGQPWTAETAFELAVRTTGETPAHLASEIDRYLGWPGQAICYKLGERVWLEARTEYLARHSSSTLREFHRESLGLGHMGLAAFRRELARR